MAPSPSSGMDDDDDDDDVHLSMMTLSEIFRLLFCVGYFVLILYQHWIVIEMMMNKNLSHKWLPLLLLQQTNKMDMPPTEMVNMLGDLDGVVSRQNDVEILEH